MDKIKSLIKEAIKAKNNAYTPYSKFNVGAAIMTTDGKIYTGCNIENASYSATICAERTALVKAVSEGEHKFQAIALTGDSEWTYPCGICRQMLREFGKDLKIYIVKSEDEYREYKLEDLLPNSFGSDDLNMDGDK